jgi:MFS family permease
MRAVLARSRPLSSLLILALMAASGTTMMGSFSTVQEGAKAEMGLSDAVLGLVQGMGTAIPLVLFSIPIGFMVDRVRRVRLMLLLGGVYTLGTLLTAAAPNVGVLFLARMLVGIGATGTGTAAISLAADLCPPTQRGRAMLILTLGKSLGMAAAFALSGWLFGLFEHGRIAHWTAPLASWRSVHAALALFSVILLGALLLIEEPQRRETNLSTRAPIALIVHQLWKRRGFLGPLFAGQVAVVMADTAAGIWAAPVLSRNYGLHPDQFAGWMGGLLFSCGVAGSILGGVLADIGHKRSRRGFILMGAVVASAIGIPAALFPLSPTVLMFALAIGMLLLCGTITSLVTAVTITVLLPNELRGLCTGILFAIAGTVGYGIAPTLVSSISSLLGGEQYLAQALAIVGVAAGALSFGGFVLALRRAPASIADVDPPATLSAN